MDKMMEAIHAWRRDPRSLLPTTRVMTEARHKGAFVLIVEGFLIFDHSSRVYTPPDPPGYFEGHVWPMYLKHRQEMESVVQGIVLLDGLKPQAELLGYVYDDVTAEIQNLMANDDGDYFPIWGTCLGMQLLTALTAGEDLLTKTPVENIALPLNMTEGKEYPFYGVQWHPEVNRFQWDPDMQFPHSANAVRVSALLAEFFINEVNYDTKRRASGLATERCLVKWLEVRCVCPMCNKPISGPPEQHHSIGTLLDELV
ncbi:hypothetical protein NHX12_028295 [Muraenolepis orangiensis]|uniref:Folate gamma-glutamyl hydrolase n=1 Tax=Muraenolepis orangiensis TaxID=630683 RepID=A0A9Q0IME6_9TELE|nr:hypothetical protein NHX12_028295 [Muraenolepis orangiensis]